MFMVGTLSSLNRFSPLNLLCEATPLVDCDVTDGRAYHKRNRTEHNSIYSTAWAIPPVNMLEKTDLSSSHPGEPDEPIGTFYHLFKCKDFTAKIKVDYTIGVGHDPGSYTWVELFRKSWWGKMSCQLMVVLGKPGLENNQL